ncbi:MAG: phenylalanine--tRNA ligase subunit beta [Betaproteobacteria bacterium]|nr:phenylalanine--tRNA ligase subunit beta [Betaproteobacteria bacterium]
MQFPESWLRTLCNPSLSTGELAERLTMAGLEVEELRPVAPPFSKVVVAEIVTAEQHPNADRLRVCQVDAGVHSKEGPLQIVCGAPNARVGIKVPLALVGAQLPAAEGGKPFEIKVGQLRGVQSWGMLCSARELQLSEDHEGLLELPADAPLGADVRGVLGLDDTLFTLKLTPNLAHHLSLLGVAREVSALTGAPLQEPSVGQAAVAIEDRLPVRIEAPDLCGRFSGRIVRGINPAARTPGWMVERLARCGQRPVNAIVDISNYVMFELGQPTHIFDLAKVKQGLSVRWAQAGETLQLLNGQTVTLDSQVGVIADESGVESLAGIMGGQATAVGDGTRDVYIEAAFWWPKSVAGRARRYNFSTDAGHRFERGVDPRGTVRAIERITELLLAICGTDHTRCGPVDDQWPGQQAEAAVAPVGMRVSRAAKVLGMKVTREQCESVFSRLGFEYRSEGDVIHVKPPSYRFDLQIEEDLIEEIARLVGFDQLPDTPPLAPVTARVRVEAQRGSHAVRHVLAGLDYQEGIHFSFVEERWERELAGHEHPIRVLNPIASPLAVMRSSLIGSLLQAARGNLARKASRVRLFEIGRVFMRDASVVDSDTTVAGIHQPLKVAALALGPVDRLQWATASRPVDFFDVKGDVEALMWPLLPEFVPAEHPAFHPGRGAAVMLDGQLIGHVGELHPRWRQAYDLPSAPGLFELDLQAVLRRPVPLARAVSRQQPVWRDLALVAGDELSHDRLIGVLQQDPQGVVRSARLFDVYKPKSAAADLGANERSLAVRLELLDETATLTDDRIEAAVEQALERAARVGARLRAVV